MSSLSMNEQLNPMCGRVSAISRTYSAYSFCYYYFAGFNTSGSALHGEAT